MIRQQKDRRNGRRTPAPLQLVVKKTEKAIAPGKAAKWTS